MIRDFTKLTGRTANGQVDLFQTHGITHHIISAYNTDDAILRVFVRTCVCMKAHIAGMGATNIMAQPASTTLHSIRWRIKLR